MVSSTGGEFRGKTVEEAIEAGLEALSLKRNQVDVEILNRGSRGLLGFGAEEARVRLTPLRAGQPAPSAQPTRPKPPAPEAEPARAQPAGDEETNGDQADERTPATAASAQPVVFGDADVADIAVDLLQGMLDRMDVRATAQAVPYRGVLDVGQDAPLVLNIEGDDLGILIGRRAETLAAIQYLTRLMVNHKTHRWVNLVVDVEGYKARREEQLVKLAERMADRVATTGKVVTLEAMPARERRIIHITLRDHPQVTTESVGEGEHRKVTIIPRV
jgi:spoIIIJ-associated protein